ncbi:hypothetical protein [Streptomyces sp. NPDC095613]|uniref:hypothetical protein n=1 Tax=Streptomyces sp. NPDC095613 TaxID=3155540 RepID=UPI0033223E6C
MQTTTGTTARAAEASSSSTAGRPKMTEAGPRGPNQPTKSTAALYVGAALAPTDAALGASPASSPDQASVQRPVPRMTAVPDRRPRPSPP